mmetsp:Transcript_13129/g.30189  ORF Transcript_13129/g.30189 Transcript_13129/m.30189 type:complete len:267 (+) Transcript_13129:6785-7585(+)
MRNEDSNDCVEDLLEKDAQKHERLQSGGDGQGDREPRGEAKPLSHIVGELDHVRESAGLALEICDVPVPVLHEDEERVVHQVEVQPLVRKRRLCLQQRLLYASRSVHEHSEVEHLNEGDLVHGSLDGLKEVLGFKKHDVADGRPLLVRVLDGICDGDVKVHELAALDSLDARLHQPVHVDQRRHRLPRHYGVADEPRGDHEALLLQERANQRPIEPNSHAVFEHGTEEKLLERVGVQPEGVEDLLHAHVHQHAIPAVGQNPERSEN